MNRNMALERVGRARVAYMLQLRGWKVGEAFDDGYDLLASHLKKKKLCLIEVKAMDISNRSTGVNLSAPLSKSEARACTHVIAYVEPQGLVFIARKQSVLTRGGNIFAAIDKSGSLRKTRKGSRSFAPFMDRWDELLR